MKSVDFATLYGVKIKGNYINFFDSDLYSYEYCEKIKSVLFFSQGELKDVKENLLRTHTSLDEDDIEIVTVKNERIKRLIWKKQKKVLVLFLPYF
jgi:hypothetical protein